MITERFGGEDCPKCQVHVGFNVVWNSFKTEIMKYLEEMEITVTSEKILVTGHSLGGAVATLAAYELR